MTRAILIEPTQQSQQNLIDFGEIIHLYAYREDKPSIFTDEFKEHFKNRLESISYDPDADYIVISGTFLMITVCVAVVASMYGSFNALQFHSGLREYVPVTMGECEDAPKSA